MTSRGLGNRKSGRAEGRESGTRKSGKAGKWKSGTREIGKVGNGERAEEKRKGGKAGAFAALVGFGKRSSQPRRKAAKGQGIADRALYFCEKSEGPASDLFFSHECTRMDTNLRWLPVRRENFRWRTFFLQKAAKEAKGRAIPGLPLGCLRQLLWNSGRFRWPNPDIAL